MIHIVYYSDYAKTNSPTHESCLECNVNIRLIYKLERKLSDHHILSRVHSDYGMNLISWQECQIRYHYLNQN